MAIVIKKAAAPAKATKPAAVKQAAPEPTNSQTLAEFVKNDNMKLVFRLNEFKGNQYIDIRTFFKPKGSEDFFPSQKGISVIAKRYGEFVTLVNKIEASMSSEPTQPADAEVEEAMA